MDETGVLTPRYVFSAAKGHLAPGLLLLDGTLRVRGVEDFALLVVELEKASLENALPNIAHELIAKVDIVLEELPAEVYTLLGKMMHAIELSRRPAIG
jgi:hypothetical protein